MRWQILMEISAFASFTRNHLLVTKKGLIFDFYESFFADENKLKLTGNCLLSFALVRERTFQVGPSQHTIQYMKKSEGSYWIKVEKKPFKKTSNESQLAFDKNFSLPELMVSIKRSISKRLHSEKIVFACLENLSDYLGLVHRACNIQWIWSNWNRFSSSFLVVPLGPQ